MMNVGISSSFCLGVSLSLPCLSEHQPSSPRVRPHGRAWSEQRRTWRTMRAGLVGEARGRTLEIGAGTGLNLAHYTDAVTELVLTEPDPHMARRLRTAARRRSAPAGHGRGRRGAGRSAPVRGRELRHRGLDARPLQRRSARQGRRRDRPGTTSPAGRGAVRRARPQRPIATALARWQDRLERPWGWMHGRLPPEPGHRRGARGRRASDGEPGSRRAAEGAAARPAPGPGYRRSFALRRSGTGFR